MYRRTGFPLCQGEDAPQSPSTSEHFSCDEITSQTYVHIFVWRIPPRKRIPPSSLSFSISTCQDTGEFLTIFSLICSDTISLANAEHESEVVTGEGWRRGHYQWWAQRWAQRGPEGRTPSLQCWVPGQEAGPSRRTPLLCRLCGLRSSGEGPSGRGGLEMG